MLANIGLYSYLTSAVAYGLLTLLLVTSWRGRPLGILLIAASAATCLWSVVIGLGTLQEYPPVTGIKATELARNVGWLYFLGQLVTMRFTYEGNGQRRRLRVQLLVGLVIAVLALFLVPHLAYRFAAEARLPAGLEFAVWLALAVVGLLLLEQLFRNANERERWTLKYLCLGLGAVFAFDFFMYAEALLFRTVDPQLWQARGFVNALAMPLLAVSIARNAETNFDIHVSRKVVFHSITLLGAGLYLLVMALAGYSIKFLDATWGGVLQVSFLAAAGALLMALLFSGKIRAQMRVLLSKHFFSYKYDYREEWLKFTDTLADIDTDVPEGIVRAMASLVGSPAGCLWGSRDDEHYLLLTHWNMSEPDTGGQLQPLAQWLTESNWVIDLDEYRREPEFYSGLELPAALLAIENAWLVVPLLFRDKLTGILLLRKSELKSSINWEDRDLLKTAGRQAASHLAQHLASQELVEARQFEAFNRLSAYVIHDLKNVLAQQSLIVANAKKHKHKPEFVDDMISTVSNSVDRMTNLMEQMRSGIRGNASLEVDLEELLNEVLAARRNQPPVPSLRVSAQPIVQASNERLLTVFGHLVQNAQEATDKDGEVEVHLDIAGQYAVVEVRDSGRGMDAEFVRNRLFKPFDSTKGLTGMGIGAFESREFIRSLGGNIAVESSPGAGSLFRVSIPLASDSDE